MIKIVNQDNCNIIIIINTIPIESGSKVTLYGRKGTVLYWAVVGSEICPSETVSTLVIIVKILILITDDDDDDVEPDVVSPARYKTIESCLGWSGWFPLLSFNSSELSFKMSS